jgi:hypothetical protein
MGVVSTGGVFRDSPGLVVQNTPQLEWWDPTLAVLVLFASPWLLERLGLLPKKAEAYGG